jgi:hypothetical protein
VFKGKAKSLPLDCSSKKGSTRVGSSLAANIKSAWQWQTLVYYDMGLIAAVKSFIVQAPDRIRILDLQIFKVECSTVYATAVDRPPKLFLKGQNCD